MSLAGSYECAMLLSTLTYPGCCVKGAIRNAYASHLERQYQLQGALHSSGGLSSHTPGKS